MNDATTHPQSPPGDGDPDERILDGIREVARRHLSIEGPISRETPIVEGLGLDSLKLLTLVVEIENHFRICLDDPDDGTMVTVDDLVAEIRSRLGDASRNPD